MSGSRSSSAISGRSRRAASAKAARLRGIDAVVGAPVRAGIPRRDRNGDGLRRPGRRGRRGCRRRAPGRRGARRASRSATPPRSSCPCTSGGGNPPRPRRCRRARRPCRRPARPSSRRARSSATRARRPAGESADSRRGPARWLRPRRPEYRTAPDASAFCRKWSINPCASTIPDSGGPERLDRRNVRLEGSGGLRVEPLERRRRSARRLEDFGEGGPLLLAGRDDELAGLPVGNVVARAEIVEGVPPFAAEPGLQRSRRVVDPGVHDLAVAAGGFHPVTRDFGRGRRARDASARGARRWPGRPRRRR